MTEEQIMEVIREWQRHWRFNEPGYFERASAIDANMRHDLKRRLFDALRTSNKSTDEG